MKINASQEVKREHNQLLSMGRTLELAIWSCDTGQRKPQFTAVQSGTQSLLAFVQRGNGLDTRRTTFNCEPWYGCWRYASLAFRTQSLLDLMSSSAWNKCNVVGGVTISKKTSCMRWVRRYQMCCAMVCGVRSLAVINIYNYYCYSD